MKFNFTIFIAIIVCGLLFNPTWCAIMTGFWGKGWDFYVASLAMSTGCNLLVSVFWGFYAGRDQ